MKANEQPIECVWRGDGALDDWGPWAPGDCFFFGGYSLSNEYKTNVAQYRKPIGVFMPIRSTRGVRGTTFCIDSAPTAKPEGGWSVEVRVDSLIVGQKPLITVHPSIHIVGLYHGWLQNGIITADLGD